MFIFSDDSGINKAMREVETLSALDSECVVKYFDSWIENNCLLIQMELCSDNLKNIIQQKPNFFKRQKMQMMSLVEFYISCQIFREILECVQFLHEKNSHEIIHRDLKPENILVNLGQPNKRFLKIGDFGLAIFHDLQSMSHTLDVGTPRYMAPEVCKRTGLGEKRSYNTKADVYSLGFIAQDVFDFDINS